jgi:predicted aspartyl protease
MNPTSRFVFTAVFALFLPVLATAQSGGDFLPIRFDRNHRVIAEGSVNDHDRVKMLIDTGATCSVVSRRLADRLHLRTLVKDFEFWAINRVVRCRIVTIPLIRLGPVHRSLSCPVADLDNEGVDFLIGRDVLDLVTLTIEYRLSRLQFVAGPPLDIVVRFDPAHPRILIPLQVGAHRMSVAVDSGADALYLFEHRVAPWLRCDPDRFSQIFRGCSGTRTGAEVHLFNVRLAGVEFKSMPATVVRSLPGDDASPTEWHGLLGLAALKAKRVRIDFHIGLFSWTR